ncbi:arginine ABC transporter permease ArtQ [Vibrio sp. SS-MA-C1-2]|uniref:arginine ABC transporter permease ArtQ n=1 Tax=Vibrio sp. SS-MA-C1-2 TaxID=2908646 RepID=UPI001F1F8394|nr:arginine ABC transporter permease ArtQ [Vibrio sp. SS-MA-C1-2]UJF20175.1 arginine ABC transporter permease ArtQ [Vibrio sp. SS-MA-C1-2]
MSFESGYGLLLVQASWMTIQLAVASLALGLILSIIFTLGETNKFKMIAWPTTIFVTLLRGLPELLVVLFIFFGSSQIIFYITGEFVEISPFLSGTIALALIFASYASQTIRGALKAVSKGQVEAATALGIGRAYTSWRIIAPQAAIHALPGLTNQWLVLLKDTALVSLIGVTELLKQAQLTAAVTHQSFNWYAGVAVIYLVISLVSQKLIDQMNKKLAIPGHGN